jgi:hypothetical protein
MKVYCLFSGSYEDRDLIDVYSTLQGAQSVDHGHVSEWSAYPGRWYCEWTRTNHRARVPVDIKLDNIEVPVVNGVATLPNGSTVSPPEGIKVVVVPVLPPGVHFEPEQTWTDHCDYAIVEYTLRD